MMALHICAVLYTLCHSLSPTMDSAQDVVLLPGGGMLATASANTLTIWDILSGGRVLQAVSAHSKTITSLSATSDGRHILSASLDRMVKVYELGSYKVCSLMRVLPSSFAPVRNLQSQFRSAHPFLCPGGRVNQVCRTAPLPRAVARGLAPRRRDLRQLALCATAESGTIARCGCARRRHRPLRPPARWAPRSGCAATSWRSRPIRSFAAGDIPLLLAGAQARSPGARHTTPSG